MSIPFAERTLSGWGRMEHAPCAVYRPEQARGVAQVLASGQHAHYIARGLGRSYGDTAVNEGGGVVDFSRLDRMLAFDEETGVLACEAGVSLADIIATFLPRGWFLPVTPGTKFVTVGGAIANDVHGKNHHRDGTFGQFVLDCTLVTPAGDTVRCSPEEDPALFWATVGGIGLTGLILEARVRLQRVSSAHVLVDYYRSRDLDDALATMAATDADYQYSVGWVNCLARGARLGQTVLMRGNHAPPDALPPDLRARPYHVPPRRDKSVPFDFPGFVLNTPCLRAFNKIFYAMYRDRAGVLVDYDHYFYPLDGILHWNRMYGRRGFVQYQATLPPESGRGLVKLLERLGTTGRASFLAVLKCFGEGGPGLLSHPMKGYTLTLDIPNKPGLRAFLGELDRILLDHGGRLYLAKDAVAAPEAIAAMYPRLDAFREVKARVDPDNRLSSSMARRLGIVHP